VSEERERKRLEREAAWAVNAVNDLAGAVMRERRNADSLELQANVFRKTLERIAAHDPRSIDAAWARDALDRFPTRIRSLP
jgi:hypothetical protein